MHELVVRWYFAIAITIAIGLDYMMCKCTMRMSGDRSTEILLALSISVCCERSMSTLQCHVSPESDDDGSYDKITSMSDMAATVSLVGNVAICESRHL